MFGDQTYPVKKAQIKPVLDVTFPEYKGRTFKVQFTDKVTFSDTNWGGGTRSFYKFVQMDTGKVAPLSVPAPWDNQYEGKTMDLPENIVVVEHIIFCGQDLGIRFYVHPSLQRMLAI